MRTISNAQLTTTSTIELDLTPGNVIYDDRGRKYIKCKTSSIVGNGDVAAVSTAATSHRGYLIPTVTRGGVANSDKVVGWNKTGSAVAAGKFFWCMVGPIVEQVVSDGVIAANSRVYSIINGKVSALPDGLEGANVGTALTAASGDLVDVLRRDG